MNCKTCKWWKAVPERENWEFGDNIAEDITTPTQWPQGTKIPVEFEVRYCTHPKLLFCERPLESDGFAVADGSHYMANLFTAEDFGCKLHEL